MANSTVFSMAEDDDEHRTLNPDLLRSSLVARYDALSHAGGASYRKTVHTVDEEEDEGEQPNAYDAAPASRDIHLQSEPAKLPMPPTSNSHEKLKSQSLELPMPPQVTSKPPVSTSKPGSHRATNGSSQVFEQFPLLASFLSEAGDLQMSPEVISDKIQRLERGHLEELAQQLFLVLKRSEGRLTQLRNSAADRARDGVFASEQYQDGGRVNRQNRPMDAKGLRRMRSGESFHTGHNRSQLPRGP